MIQGSKPVEQSDRETDRAREFGKDREIGPDQRVGTSWRESGLRTARENLARLAKKFAGVLGAPKRLFMFVACVHPR